MDYESMIVAYVVLLISLVVHEASHAFVALLGGDRTAYVGGQVSLNPIPHIQREPFGTVLLPLLMLNFSGGQWLMGYAHTPIDPYWADRHPKRAALMSAAGPISNFLLAGLAFLGLKAFLWADMAEAWATGEQVLGGMSFIDPIDDDTTVLAIGRILSTFLFLNVVLGIFNLIPWPPLDGAGILEGVARKQTGPFYRGVRSNPFFIILGMVAIWNLLPELLWPVLGEIIDWI